MKWVDKFDLFLFDLDGLLVNSEYMHFEAYKRMLKNQGFDLSWDFNKFCKIAHRDEKSLENGIYGCFPHLKEIEPNWTKLRNEKNSIFLKIIKNEKIDLLPGVENLLNELEKKNIKRSVVTNSTKEMVDLIIKNQSKLRSIPNWITREHYTRSKPFPDGYLYAIEKFANNNDRIIGFEDSQRGIKALKTANICPVMINETISKHVDIKDIFHFFSFENIPDNFEFINS